MATIQHRRNIKQYWENTDPVLAPGELGLEIGVDGAPDRFKIGNGLSNWKQLKYFINETEIDLDAGRLSQEALDSRYESFGAANFANRQDVIPDLYSYFGNKENQYTPPTHFDSLHPMTFAGNASPVIAGGTLMGVGSGPRAFYARTPNMGQRITRIAGRFRVLPGSGVRTNGGTGCLAITDDLINPISGVNVSMPVHFLTTAKTWYFTVWVEGSGQVVLATGDYVTPLKTDYVTEYEMQCWLNGTTATFDLPDGTRRTVEDSRIGSFGANYGFFEGYQPNGDTDDIFAFTHVLVGLGVPRIPDQVLSKTTLDSLYLPAVTSKPSGDNRVGIINWQQDSAVGYLIHLTVGPNSGANNAAFAIGTDRGLGSGLLISHKNAGRGLEIGVQPGAGAGLQIQGRSSSFPLRVQMFPGAGAVSLRASSGAGFSDGVTVAGNTTLTSATAAFVAGDVGKTLTQLTSRGVSDPFGAIPPGTTIASFTDATRVVMSAPAGANATGLLFEVGSRLVGDAQSLLVVQDENSATLSTLSKDGLTARGATAASVPLRAYQKAGQTSPIFAIYDSASNLLTYIGGKGHLMSGVKTAIVAGDLNTSRMGWWLDDTAGAPKIKFAAKDSAGTFRTFELAAL